MLSKVKRRFLRLKTSFFFSGKVDQYVTPLLIVFILENKPTKFFPHLIMDH